MYLKMEEYVILIGEFCQKGAGLLQVVILISVVELYTDNNMSLYVTL